MAHQAMTGTVRHCDRSRWQILLLFRRVLLDALVADVSTRTIGRRRDEVNDYVLRFPAEGAVQGLRVGARHKVFRRSPIPSWRGPGGTPARETLGNGDAAIPQ